MTEFRQAVSYGIDYQAIIDKVFDGVGEVPSRGYCSPALMGFDQNLGRLEHNPKKAEEILSRMGFIDSDRDGLRESEDGKKMKIPLTPYPEVYVNQAAHLMASQLRLLGLDAYVETLDRDSLNQKLWLDRDYCIAVGYSTPFGCMGADTAAIYYADMPGMYGTCSDSELIRMVEMAICSKNLAELDSARMKIQAYVARELPMIALVWRDASYPIRSEGWKGWTNMMSYGPVNYWSWFSIR